MESILPAKLWRIAPSRIGTAVGTYLVPISLSTIGIGNTMLIGGAITLVGAWIAWMILETQHLEPHQVDSFVH